MDIKIQEHFNKLKDIVYKEYNVDVKVNITFNLKSTRTLGTCQLNNIDLNPILLEHYGFRYIEEIGTHEFCHAVVHKLYPFGWNDNTRTEVKSHGKEFKRVCRLLGISTKATSSLDVDGIIDSKQNKHLHKCKCTTHKLTTFQHNKLIRGKREYFCSLCKTKLK